MLRRPVDDPAGWLLDGVWHSCEAEYLAALDKRNARRRRLFAWMEADSRGESWHSFDARWRD